MNIKGIFYLLGKLLLLIAIAMILPILIGIFYKEKDLFAFILSSGITAFCGIMLCQISSFNHKRLSYKDGFVIVTLGWVLASLFGSLPFMLTGVFSHPLDAFFESVSGFTTTGASVIPRVEYLSQTILLWRGLTHWLGGMGIIVMAIAILPELAGNMHLFHTEVTGPLQDRIKPRIKETARTILLIYISLTFLEYFLLRYNGLPRFLALVDSFSTISTGGFSTSYSSIGGYNSPKIEMIIIIFMFLGGINFNLIYQTIRGNLRYVLKDEELRFYIIILSISSALIAFNLFSDFHMNWYESIRHSIFQVISISTTTGFATKNFDIWPSFSRWILLVLMFIGGSAGSTSGGLKVIRIKALIKICLQVLRRLLHPGMVKNIKINNFNLSNEMATSILGFFFLYITVFVIATTLLTFQGTDIISSISAAASSLGNIGPGLKLVGPLNSYLTLPLSSRFILIICMLMGRLEIYTVLVFICMDWR